MFTRKQDKFAVHLSHISSNLIESTTYFADFTFSNLKDVKEYAMKMKDYEVKGDTMVHHVITDLNNVFITPIEREDILALAENMDEILDGLEHICALFEIYSITTIDEYMKKFAEAIQKCTIEIDKAIEYAFTKKLPEISKHAIKIKTLEAQCNDVWRESIKNLFKVEKDPIRIMKYKEIYEAFEEVSDSCERVANTFEAIIMKNA